MLVTVQYPVVDCRGLVSEESYKLVKPYFANPSPNEFLRNFGRVGRRDISYRDYCRNEDIFCHADNAVHMPAMYPVSEGVVAARARSRIFSNGANLYRVEVRMEVYAAEGVAWPEDLLCRMASVPLRVRGEGGRYVTCRVADAGGDAALSGMACWVVARRDMETGSRRIPVLRTLLFRIHGEKQSLLLTARFISMAYGGAGTGINAARARGYVAGTIDGLLRNRRFNMPQGELVDYAFAIDNNHAREDYERILDVVRQWQDQFMEEDLVLLFRRIDYDKIINDIVALPDYYVNTFWHEVVSRLRQRNKVGVKSLLRKSRPLVAALARDMATGAIINMLLGG